MPTAAIACIHHHLSWRSKGAQGTGQPPWHSKQEARRRKGSLHRRVAAPRAATAARFPFLRSASSRGPHSPGVLSRLTSRVSRAPAEASTPHPDGSGAAGAPSARFVDEAPTGDVCVGGVGWATRSPSQDAPHPRHRPGAPHGVTHRTHQVGALALVGGPPAALPSSARRLGRDRRARTDVRSPRHAVRGQTEPAPNAAPRHPHCTLHGLRVYRQVAHAGGVFAARRARRGAVRAR